MLNLNENIQKQAEEAEKQQVVLEETVKERTSELEEKKYSIRRGIESVKLNTFPPKFMMRCLRGSTTQRLKHKEGS